MTKVRVHSIDQQRSFLLLLLAAATLLAAAFVGVAAAYAQDAEGPTESPAATAAASDDGLVPDGIDGTWTVDTEIGDFKEFSGSWVGFRVAEVLDRVGDAEAVGRTPVVSGELVVRGSTIESATIEADLTTIRSDQARRDPAIQRALDTRTFPSATFESAAAVDLGAVPVDGEPFTASVPGIITIHGVSQVTTLELTGQRVGDVVVVVGTLPLDFSSFGITMPTAPIVVSVEDQGDLEWQLFFNRTG